MAMNPEIKAKWLEALRSGKYKQTTGVLRRNDTNKREGYCCLGVLCAVVAPEIEWVPGSGDCLYFMGESGLPPMLVREKAGIKDNDVLTTDAFSELPDLNDEGHTFPEIADFIEANL